jgi:hypothetical protein
MAGQKPPPKVAWPIDARDAEIAQLKEGYKRLANLLENMAQANAFGQIFAGGLEEIAAKLAPLEQLAPIRSPISESAAVELNGIRTSLLRPTYSDWRSEGHGHHDIPARAASQERTS